MKNEMNGRRFLRGALALAMMGGMCVATVQAQDQKPDGQPPRERRPDGQRPPEGGQRPEGGFPRPQGGFQRGNFQPGMGVDLKLTEEQRQAVQAASQESREEMRTISEKMREARRALQEATIAEKSDAEVIKQKAAEVGKAEGEMALVNAKILAKVRPKLTGEQLEKLKNAPSVMVLFASPGQGEFRGQPDGARRPGQGDGVRRPGQGDGEYRRPRTGASDTPVQPQRPPAAPDAPKPPQ